MQKFWMDFLELNGKRTCSESGFAPISFKEIEAWVSLSGAEISQFWLDTIDMLDQTWLRIQSKK